MSGTQQTAFGGSHRQAITQTGYSSPINLDWLQVPFGATVVVDCSQAVGAVYGVQFTLDDLNDANIASPLWQSDTTLPPGQNASGSTKYTTPAKFIRLAVTQLTSGTIYVTMVQGVGYQ